MKRFIPGIFSTHKPVHHEAERRKRYYQENFKKFFQSGILRMDVSSIKLSLDDEDVRYTTDPEPGLYDKVRCVEILLALSPKQKEQFKTIMQRRLIKILDAYSAPGMDVLYSMLIPFVMRNVRVFVTGVSLVKDAHDERRFQRMERNVGSMMELLKSDMNNVQLIRGDAAFYCENYVGDPLDILILSPPWLSSHGEMEKGVSDQARSAEDIGAEMDNLILKFKMPPKIVSLMIPYDWNEISPHMEHLVSKYGAVETTWVIKKSSHDHHEISSYFIHIIAQNYKGMHKIREYVYYM